MMYNQINNLYFNYARKEFIIYKYLPELKKRLENIQSQMNEKIL